MSYCVLSAHVLPSDVSLSKVGPGRFGRQASVADIYHAMPCHVQILRLKPPIPMRSYMPCA